METPKPSEKEQLDEIFTNPLPGDVVKAYFQGFPTISIMRGDNGLMYSIEWSKKSTGFGLVESEFLKTWRSRATKVINFTERK